MILLTSHPRISLAIKWYTYNRVPLHSNTTLKSLMKALPFRAVLYFSIVHTGDKEGVSVPGTFSEHSNKNVEPRCRHQQRKSQSRRSFFLSNWTHSYQQVADSVKPDLFFLFQTSIGWVILKSKIDAVWNSIMFIQNNLCLRI